MTTEINWSVSQEDADTIAKIVQRVTEELPHLAADRMSLTMDITATHGNGCPLRLGELLEADALNFAHDIAGIRFHINRETGRLEGFFLPRFAARVDAEEARS